MKLHLNCENQLIETTLTNYRLGCAKPIELALGKYGDLFTHTLYMLMKNRLPVADQVLMQQAASVREKAVMAVRCEEFALAEQLFAEARIPLESNSLSTEGSLLHRSLLEQSEAYLDYRRGNFDQVYVRTSKALAIDVDLEDNYGYDILLIHRIQLLHNLVRTEARRMCFDRAMELAYQLLNYLEGRTEELPFLGQWGSQRVARQPPEAIAATFAQITSEIAVILAGKDFKLARDLFAIFTRLIQTDHNYYAHPRAYAWLLLKQAFVDKDITHFLEAASSFLVEGRADTPLLWYAAVVDVVATCSDVNFPSAELVKQEVARDAAQWKFLPPRFLLLLNICAR